jgi:hypothetical protein
MNNSGAEEPPAKDLTPDEAKDRVRYVRAMVAKCEEMTAALHTPDAIKAAVPEFARDYPHLFEAVVSTEPYSKQSLRTMLAMLDRMAEGTLKQHQASVIVGERLVQTFVKPQMQSQPQ